MVTTMSERKPNYFFVVFGDDPSKPPVEGGVYPRKEGYIGGSGVSAGDVLLLYENLGCQGIGVATSIETGGTQELSLPVFPALSPTELGLLGRSSEYDTWVACPFKLEGKFVTKRR